MVKKSYLLVITLTLCQICIGQSVNSLNSGRLDVTFETDTISHGEYLDLYLKISNNTNEVLNLYTPAYLALHHFSRDHFVSYDSPNRISHPVSFPDGIENELLLSPKESFQWKQSILIDTTFFSYGKNELIAIYNSESYKRKYKADKKASFIGSLESVVFNIFVLNTCKLP